MSDVLTAVIDVTVKDLDALRTVMDELTAKVQADEPGTLVYEWYLSEDESSAWFIERYADSDALLVHLGGFGAVAERFMAAADMGTFRVHGNPSDAAREAIAMLGPVVFDRQNGIER